MSGLYVREELEEGLRHFVPAKDRDVLAEARLAVRRRMRHGSQLFNSPTAAGRYLVPLLAGLDYEVFCIAHLDNRHRLIAFEELFRGTIDSSHVYPRVLLASVLRNGSTAVVLVHNHPSGAPSSSAADQLVTKRIQALLEAIEVRVLDHFIVAGEEVYSMSNAGEL